jgi:hypothetical protein
MATSTYLSNPDVTVNSVDLTDQCTAATFTHRFDQFEATSFGDTARNFVSGLGNHELTLRCTCLMQLAKPTQHSQPL